MTDYCLKRFFEEEHNDVKLYYDYLINKRFVNLYRYSVWLNTLDKRNSLFAEKVIEGNFINSDDIIIESAVSKEYCVSNYFNNEIIMRFAKEYTIPIGLFNTDKNSQKGNFCYICNGIYSDTLTRINQVLENGSFAVGISYPKHDKRYKEIIKYYNNLNMLLQKREIETDKIDDNCSNDYKIYMLKYNSRNKKR